MCFVFFCFFVGFFGGACGSQFTLHWRKDSTLNINASSFTDSLNSTLVQYCIFLFFFRFWCHYGFQKVDPSHIRVRLNYFCLQWPGARLLRFSLHCHSCDPGEVQCCCLGNHSDPCYWCRDSVNMGKEKVRHEWEKSDMSAGGGWSGGSRERQKMTRCA